MGALPAARRPYRKAHTVYLDRTEYHISQPGKIVGILLAMLRKAAETQSNG